MSRLPATLLICSPCASPIITEADDVVSPGRTFHVDSFSKSVIDRYNRSMRNTGGDEITPRAPESSNTTPDEPNKNAKVSSGTGDRSRVRPDFRRSVREGSTNPTQPGWLPPTQQASAARDSSTDPLHQRGTPVDQTAPPSPGLHGSLEDQAAATEGSRHEPDRARRT